MKQKIKLFFIIPVYVKKEIPHKKVIKIFGIPVYKRKTNSNETKIQYKLFGIPVLKIKKG